MVVGTVVGYCSRPNRKGEVKKEQRQRTKGGKECQKKKMGTRASVFYCRRICRIDRAWHRVRGWRHTLKGETEGAEDLTGMAKMTLGYRRLIQSTDSSHVEMISVPKREVTIDETISNRFAAIPECITPP